MRTPAALLLPTLVLAGCASNRPPPHVAVRKVPGKDGGWYMPEENKEDLIVLDATGTKTTLKYAGRLFVVEPFDGYHGVLAYGEVILRDAYLELHVTRERARWQDHGKQVTIALSEIPKGSTATLRGDRWVVEVE